MYISTSTWTRSPLTLDIQVAGNKMFGIRVADETITKLQGLGLVASLTFEVHKLSLVLAGGC